MITEDAKSVVEVMRRGMPAGRKIIPSLPKGWVSVSAKVTPEDIADYVERSASGKKVWDSVLVLADVLSDKAYVTLQSKGSNHEGIMGSIGVLGKSDQYWYARIRITLKDNLAGLVISTNFDDPESEQSTQKKLQKDTLMKVADKFSEYYKRVSKKTMPRLSLHAQEGKTMKVRKDGQHIYENSDIKLVCSHMRKRKARVVIDPYSLPDTSEKKDRRESVERLVKKGKGKIKWDQESLSIIEA